MAKVSHKEAIQQLKGVIITQSNNVSSAHYNYSLLQERVFTMLMYHLQVYVREVMNGKRVEQLDLFRQQQSTIIVEMPLYYITTPDHYGEVREVCEKMTTIQVVMNDPQKRIRKVTGLIASVQTTYNGMERVNRLSLELRNDIVAMLLHIDRNNRDQPSQYTQFHLAVCMQFRNKYSSKIYKFLSSWKNKGGCRVSLQELRSLLQLPEKRYTNFNDLKRFILQPVQKELRELADIWYNCAAAGFAETETGTKKVQWLNFKIIVPMSEEMLRKKIEALKWNLSTNWKCSGLQVKTLDPYLHADTDWELIAEVLDKCYNYRQENHITNLGAYVTKAIVNALAQHNTPLV